MTAVLFLLLAAAGSAVLCCGLVAAIRRRGRLALRLWLAGGMVLAAGDAVGRVWPLAAAQSAIAGLAAWDLWRYRQERPR